MSWKEDSEGGGQGRKTTEGNHLYEVMRCMRYKKDGTELTSTKGDACLMVIVKDEEDGEGVLRYYLSDKARWKLARDLSRLGVDCDELDQRGVSIADFEQLDFAENELMGRVSPGYAQPDGQYMEIDLLPIGDVRPEAEQDRIRVLLADVGKTAPATQPATEPDEPPMPVPSDGEDTDAIDPDEDCPF